MEKVELKLTIKDKKQKVNLSSKEITGVIGINYNDILSDLVNYKNYTCRGKKVTLKVIEEFPRIYSLINTVKDYFLLTIKLENIEIKREEKKLKDALKIVGLDPAYLDRMIITLSTSELKLINIANSLLSNPDIIVFKNPYRLLDLNNQKRLSRLIERMKDQYQKIIIIISDDCEYIYKYTSRVLILKNNNILIDNLTKEAYSNVNILMKNKISIPKSAEFSNKVRNKQIKIDYHRDIRDLIKDIYKHI